MTEVQSGLHRGSPNADFFVRLHEDVGHFVATAVYRGQEIDIRQFPTYAEAAAWAEQAEGLLKGFTVDDTFHERSLSPEMQGRELAVTHVKRLTAFFEGVRGSLSALGDADFMAEFDTMARIANRWGLMCETPVADFYYERRSRCSTPSKPGAPTLPESAGIASLHLQQYDDVIWAISLAARTLSDAAYAAANSYLDEELSAHPSEAVCVVCCDYILAEPTRSRLGAAAELASVITGIDACAGVKDVPTWPGHETGVNDQGRFSNEKSTELKA